MTAIHEFLLIYGWELMVASISTVIVCTVFGYWIDLRNKLILKQWRPYEKA